MKLSILFITSAIFFGISGLSGLIAPNYMLGTTYYAEAGELTPWVTRLNGAMFLGFAILSWFARNSEDSDARRAILIALTTVNGFFFLLHLIAAMMGGLGPPPLLWFSVAIFLFFTIGFGYFLFMKPESA